MLACRLMLGAWFMALPASTLAASAPANFTSTTLQALNKVTARVSTLEVKPLLPTSFGTLDIEVKRCWHSPDGKQPEQAVLLDVRERQAQGGQSSAVFSGWMFASSPALSALEHPVYDLTLISCTP